MSSTIKYSKLYKKNLRRHKKNKIVEKYTSGSKLTKKNLRKHRKKLKNKIMEKYTSDSESSENSNDTEPFNDSSYKKIKSLDTRKMKHAKYSSESRTLGLGKKSSCGSKKKNSKSKSSC